ncbi:hypothetical protein C8F01DRAFT_1087819 [Mycena amicta]|nr:hypothetical protein C8F01DRAFT_1087819 [Mycena amicta]
MDGAPTERDKFQRLDSLLMPASIMSWQRALASVHQDVTPLSTNLDDRSEGQRRRLHHWNLLRDAFVFVLSDQENETAPSYSGQQWRDILDGLLTKRGDAEGTMHQRKRNRRTDQLQELIRPALDACNVETVEGIPVPSDSLPEFTEECAREIIWEVAETRFRYEFCALDHRASLKAREDMVKHCFAGGMLIGAPLEKSQRGFSHARLDFDLPSANNYLAAHVLKHCNSQGWNPDQQESLETAICDFYMQSFWEHFGRAAIIPMRLEHIVSM